MPKMKQVTMQVGVETTGQDNLKKLGDSIESTARKGEKAMDSLAKETEVSSKQIERAFSALGVKSMPKLEKQIQAAQSAYDTLAKSGKVSARDLAKAQDALAGKVKKLRKEYDGAGKSVAGFDAKVKSLVATIAGLYVAREIFSGVSGAMLDADKAALALRQSLVSAAREFGDTVGSWDSWDRTIQRLRGELLVFSQVELQQAAAAAITSTKVWGANEQQMAEVVQRTADLTAGKFDLLTSTNEVAAALRGEAEAVEKLGLTLGETYVKAWYEASGAAKGAWKDLSDMEKWAVRYQVFLEQTEAYHGQAADSVKSFSGALKLVRTAFVDAVANNEDLVESMKNLAAWVKENKEEIGELATGLVQLIGWFTKFLVQNKELLAVLGGAAGVAFLVDKTRKAVAALGIDSLGAVKGLLTLTRAVKGLSAALAVYLAMKIVNKHNETVDLLNDISEGNERLQSDMEKQALAYNERFKALHAQRTKDATVATQKTVDQAEPVYGNLARLGENAYADIARAAQESGKAQVQSTQDAAKAQQSALEKLMSAQQKLYQDSVSMEDDLAQIRQRDMTPAQREQDNAMRATKELALAQEELAKAEQLEGAEQDAAMERSRMHAERARSLGKSLEDSGKAARIVGDAWGVIKELDSKGLIRAAQDAAAAGVSLDTLNKVLGQLKTSIDDVPKQVDIAVWTDDEGVINFTNLLDRIPESKTVTIYTETAPGGTESAPEQHSQGGLAGSQSIPGFASGGLLEGFRRYSAKLPGYGGGDRIRALLEAGEYISDKRTVAFWGPQFFADLKAMARGQLNLARLLADSRAMVRTPSLPKLADGGYLGPMPSQGNPMSALKDYGVVRLDTGNMQIPAVVTKGVMDQVTQQLRRENLTRSQGRRR